MEANICLDSTSDRDASLNCFVKAPANLVVLEGDCLGSGGDAGELESYLVLYLFPFVENVHRLLDVCRLSIH